jgi:hypothetical protein
MKFVEKLDRDEVRNICIKYNLCTKMSNEEYSNMLNKCKDVDEHYSLLNIITSIAVDIFNGSSASNVTFELTLENITGIIFNRCVIRYTEAIEG